MKVEVLFLEGCPNHAPTTALVREALQLRGVTAEVTEVEIFSAQQAAELRFLGSPTVRINGTDIEPEARKSTAYAFGCRTYTDQGARSGTPSRVTLMRAIDAIDESKPTVTAATDPRST